MDFPTLGLNFDLNALIEGVRKLKDTRDLFKDVGQSAADAGKKVEDVGKASDAAADKAEKAAQRKKRAAKTEEDAINAQMRQLRELDRVTKAMATVDRIEKRVARLAPPDVSKDKAAIEKAGLTLVTVANDQAVRVQAAIARMIAPSALGGTERNRMQAQLNATFGAIASSVEASTLNLITVSDNAGQRLRGALERLISPDALKGSERARFQSQLEATFNAMEADIDKGGLTLITKIDRQAARIQGAMQRMIAPGALTGASRSSRQAELEMAFTPIPPAASSEARVYTRGIAALGETYDVAKRKQASFDIGLGGLGTSLAKVRRTAFDLRFAIGTLLGGFAVKPIIDMADQMVALESRTSLYAKRASDVPQILEETYAVAQRARAPLEGIATLYTRLAPLADNLGRSQRQLLGIVETVGKAFSIGRASAAEATAGAQQFAQALSSNRFGGDELRSVAENAPVLLAALAEGVNQINPALNLNAATFIKWAQAGNANSEIMVKALEAAKAKIDKMFASTTPTISQAGTVILNSLTKLVDQIDRRSGEAGMRLSTNLAMGLVEFGEFLNRQSTVDAMVASVEVLKAVIGGLGTVIALTAQYFPTLVAAMVAFTVAAKSALIIQTVTTVLGPLNALLLLTATSFQTFGIKAGAAALGANIASSAMATLGATAKAAGAVIMGPLGIAAGITVLALGFNFLKTNTLSTAQALEKLTSGQETANNAYGRAITFLETYGGGTDAVKKQIVEMNKAIDASLDLTSEQMRGLSDAGAAAVRRAAQEKALTVSLLQRAAAEQIALQASLNRSAGIKEIDARAGELALRLPTARIRLPGQPSIEDARRQVAEQRRSAERDRQLGAMLNPDGLMAMATAIKNTPLDIPAIADGSGIANLGGDDKKGGKGKGMAGAINSVAKLRAEVEGLNAQIKALNADPLSDIAARIQAAGNEASASRTAGKGSGFADEAGRLAALKEEASIRLDLTRSLVEQERASKQAGEAAYRARLIDQESMASMVAFYAAGTRSSADYARSIQAQAEALTAGEKEQASLNIAQAYGVTSVSKIAGAYRDALDQAGLLTEETGAYADALQEQAERTYAAAAATIDLETAQRRGKQSAEAALARRAEIVDLQDYATALRAGAAAVDAYNLRRQVMAATDAAGPGQTTGVGAVDRALNAIRAINIATDVRVANEARYNVALAESTSEMEEQLRLATLTTRQRQIEAAAIELARKGGRTAANDNDRIKAEDILKKTDLADLKTNIQDTLRNSFIQTGKFDFSAIADKLAQTLRQRVFDKLIAKPLEVAVNAGVDFLDKGIEKLLGAAGPWGQAAAVALAVASQVLGKERITDTRDYRQTAEETQALQGTGTVLGSLKAQSKSLKNSIDIVARYQNRTLEYSNGMLKALNSIDSGIGSLTGLIGRQLGLGGSLDTSELGLGTKTTGPGLLTKLLSPISWVLPGLFGKSTTTNLMDQGLQFNASNLGSILSGGVNGYTYQDLEQNTKKKFLGVTYSNKTSYTTQKGALDSELATQIGLVIGSLKDGAVEAANILGIAGADALLNSMMINIGRISFKDMSGEEIQDQLNAVFGKVADDMAAVVLPIIGQFQKAGEGAFETLTRVARQYQVVDVYLSSIGKTFGAVGVGSLAARERLIELVGGLDEFVSKTQFFADNFLSDGERLAPIQKTLTDQLAKLGLSSVTTRDQFKRLVMGLDVSTAGGADMYAQLMNLAPAFAAVTESAEVMRSKLQEIFDYAQGLLTSSLSTRSPQEKLAIEGSQYQALLARAQAGDVDAMEKLTDASTEYLTAAQKYFAASPEYAAIFEKVYAELTALSGIAVEDPVVTTLETEFQRLIDAINAGFMLVSGGRLVIPDTTVTPGNDNSATGGGTQVGTGRGVERDLTTVLEAGFDSVNQQLAGVAEAVVGSNDDGYAKLTDTVQNTITSRSAFNGGEIRSASV